MMRALVPVAAVSLTAPASEPGEDPHHAERRAGAHAPPDHVDVARFEDLQLQRTARQQHGVQRKQRQLGCRRIQAPLAGVMREALLQRRQQFLVQATEAAIAHDQHAVARGRLLRDGERHGIDGRDRVAARSQLAHQRVRCPSPDPAA